MKKSGHEQRQDELREILKDRKWSGALARELAERWGISRQQVYVIRKSLRQGELVVLPPSEDAPPILESGTPSTPEEYEQELRWVARAIRQQAQAEGSYVAAISALKEERLMLAEWKARRSAEAEEERARSAPDALLDRLAQAIQAMPEGARTRLLKLVG